MIHLIDTNIAIHLRDGDAGIVARYATLPDIPLISIVTAVELAGGVASGAFDQRDARRNVLDELLTESSLVAFERTHAEAYLEIVQATGFSRARILDRMIAAQALRLGATLITVNIRDFRDVPGLQIEDWSQ